MRCAKMLIPKNRKVFQIRYVSGNFFIIRSNPETAYPKKIYISEYAKSSQTIPPIASENNNGKLSALTSGIHQKCFISLETSAPSNIESNGYNKKKSIIHIAIPASAGISFAEKNGIRSVTIISQIKNSSTL
jgi:hypothetical protein